ncbi:rhomboid family protein [Tenuifilum thalassicum]|uniref:Rhomboid family intramembrane serine protease n=1 Tax=Tenuifilum thalassicum TaxID=2590900 RepID=A0A7D3XFC3_9BACT|nr:rhomboid family intramembrane serine protease [Tenuifilum thalassicum]QKG80707.1 rhomboid family intramembrane serine protease [Tenuifilum thalassicum]
MPIWDEIKSSFRFGSNLTKLIYINLAVFVIFGLLRVFLFIAGASSEWITEMMSVPASLSVLILRPWTLVTYMFYHEGFLHILFNLLWLYWFGQLFLQFFAQRQLTWVYILGGISGAILYILSYNILPAFKGYADVSIAFGASASVLAIVVAVATLQPNFTIYLLFLGPVRLKYLALATIILDVISIPVSNAGGHIAHLGGALLGFVYVTMLRQGTDMAKYFYWIGRLKFPKRRKMKITYTRPESDYDYNYRKAQKQKRIDEILDKIARSGYNSLTKEEKEILFKANNRNIN